MSNGYSHMNLKMSKKEKLALIGLSALLIGYGFYQVVYGTNESSYKYGYEQGKLEWRRL